MTLHKPPPSLRCLRLFSTTLPTPKPSTQSRPPLYTKSPPPYPYGPALIYKQSDSGLYGGAIIHFGNKVSEQNAHKSRRVWRPNIHSKRLWSDSLGHFVRVKVQARVLRTITKCGGLDEYLLGEKPARIKELGLEGWRLRWLVMKSDKVRERFAREREKLGLTSVNDTNVSGTDGLENEVERASGEVVGQIQGVRASAKASTKRSASGQTPLEIRIYHIIQAISAEVLRLTSSPIDSPQDTTTTERPNRRYTPDEKRAWRAERALIKLLQAGADGEADFAAGESSVEAEVAKLEEVVKAKMENGVKEVRIRLGVAVGRLRSAREKYERARAGSADKEERKGEEKARAEERKGKAERKGEEERKREEKPRKEGILGRIRGLIGRR